MPTQQRTTRFSRVRVKDLVAFRSVHASAIAVQTKYGVEESVYQAVDDPNSLTILISGTVDEVQAWLASPERDALLQGLELDGTPESWTAAELGD